MAKRKAAAKKAEVVVEKVIEDKVVAPVIEEKVTEEVGKDIVDTCDLCMSEVCEAGCENEGVGEVTPRKIETKEVDVVVTEEVIADNPEIAEAGVKEGDVIQVPVEDKSDTVYVNAAEATAFITEVGTLTISDEGIMVNGEVCSNPTRVYNMLMNYVDILRK